MKSDSTNLLTFNRPLNTGRQLFALFLLLLCAGISASDPVRLTYGSLQIDRKFRCDGSPGIKIALHDLHLENIRGGWPTRFRLRLWQQNDEIEELRVALPENDLPATPATFPGEALWFCLANYLLEEFSDPTREYSGTIELVDTDSEEILFSVPLRFEL